MLCKFFNAPEIDFFSGNAYEMMSWFKAVWVYLQEENTFCLKGLL